MALSALGTPDFLVYMPADGINLLINGAHERRSRILSVSSSASDLSIYLPILGDRNKSGQKQLLLPCHCLHVGIPIATSVG